MEQYASQIEGFGAITITAYREDWKSQRIIERTLQMMVETCVDIAGHIISDQKLRIPDRYADTFRVLNENGILADHLCETMEKITKFRNLIVHHYDRVDAEIVIDILRNRINDFYRFRDAIVSWLKKQQR